MKTFLFILIINSGATTISVDSFEECANLHAIATEEAKKNNIKGAQFGCFEELGGKKHKV